jgi:hypothetical protein
LAASRRSGRWLWIAAAVSLAASLTRPGLYVLYPFKLFTTWVHECGHALITVLLGGHVAAIRIEPDTSGVTQSFVPADRIVRACIASAGYLGASAVGCLLMAATRVERRAHAILRSIGACMLLTLVFWIRNLFGFVVVLSWGVTLFALGERNTEWAKFVLSLLAIQVALDAVYDIRVLFLVEAGRSDAATMARLFLLPEWIWATAWMAISVAMFVWTIRATRR